MLSTLIGMHEIHRIEIIIAKLNNNGFFTFLHK